MPHYASAVHDHRHHGSVFLQGWPRGPCLGVSGAVGWGVAPVHADSWAPSRPTVTEPPGPRPENWFLPNCLGILEQTGVGATGLGAVPGRGIEATMPRGACAQPLLGFALPRLLEIPAVGGGASASRHKACGHGGGFKSFLCPLTAGPPLSLRPPLGNGECGHSPQRCL